VAFQQRFQIIDVTFVDRTFGEQHDIDAVDLVPGSND